MSAQRPRTIGISVQDRPTTILAEFRADKHFNRISSTVAKILPYRLFNDYFSQIVTNYDEDDPNRRDRAVVSSALVSLGVYNLNGIADSKVRPDPQRALQMFQFAATRFGDANAQYNLARMHLDGVGVDKDGREAIRWLFLAADKGHLQAEALLGQTLFTGREGVRPQRALGLVWLTLAREAAIDSKKDKWIIDLYDKAVAAANAGDRQDALAFLEDHLKRRN